MKTYSYLPLPRQGLEIINITLLYILNPVHFSFQEKMDDSILSEPVISIAKIMVSSKNADPANSIHQTQSRGNIIQGMELLTVRNPNLIHLISPVQPDI